MSDELDEDDITSAILAILHGTDQPKGKGEWSYNPTWFEPEVKSNSAPDRDAPTKGLNTAASRDISPTHVSSPVTKPPPQNLVPAQAPDPMPIPSMQPANSVPMNFPSTRAPNIALTNTPPVQASKSPPASDVPPAKSLPSSVNSNSTPVQASMSPSVSTASSPQNLQPTPNISLANTPMEQALNSPPTSNVPPAKLLPSSVNSTPVEMSKSPPVSNMPPVNSLPVQSSNSPANSLPGQAPNIPPINSPLAQVQDSPPVTSVPPTLDSIPIQASDSPAIPNTPPTLDNYCPAGPHFNSSPVQPSNVPQSGYDPVGPALSAQVGNKSYEMAEKFRNVGQSQSTTNTIVVQLQNMGMGGPTVTDFNLTNYLRNPTKYISAEDYDDAYRGAANKITTVKQEKSFTNAVLKVILSFIAFITCNKCTIRIEDIEANTKRELQLILNYFRALYFLFQFIFSLVQVIVQEGPVAFGVVCILFALIGFAYDFTQIYLQGWDTVKKAVKETKEQDETATTNESNPAEGAVNPQVPSPGSINEQINQAVGGNIAAIDTAVAAAMATAAAAAPGSNITTQDKIPAEKKTTTPPKMLREFAQDMLEEIIIYPSLICNLYSFINQKGWEFDSALDVFDLLLTLVSFFMDAILAKLNHIYLLYQLIKSTFDVQRQNKIYSYITPVNLFVPFSIGLAVAHILMLILIAIRIYADNFNTKDRDKEPDEGDYYVAPFTRYMIFCGAYLPLMSGACYIILNKHWFLQVSWILYNDKDAFMKMNYLNIKSMPTRVKLLGFIRDRYAYLAVSTFAPLFIAFYTGAFLRDYDENDLPDGVLSAANTVGTLFVLVFGIINFQAGIIFSIIIILLMLLLCVVCTGGGSSRDVRNMHNRATQFAK